METLVEASSHLDFFVTGGTVPPTSPSYVERAADRELYDALVAGQYSYVLNSRQMGKSSLAVRTISKITKAGIRAGFVDLTRLGGATVSADQWYAGLLAETGRALGIRSEAAKFLREQSGVSPSQRYLSFLHDVVLLKIEGPVVIMIDEIDAVRSLAFPTDELFAGIRQLYNGRATDPALNRLTLCLLGAALPGDLIRDPRTTPFNVGKRIELKDFNSAEVAAFAGGIESRDAANLVSQVFGWTGGHPFLTQTLCAELAADPKRAVEQLVRSRYLDARAREADTNLADVGNRLLGRGDPEFTDKRRADTLAQYAKLLKGGIPDDESNPSSARIKMSGVARLEGGRLVVRNRIYREVFGKRWIRDNMPGQEKRRQRRAFWLGAARTAAISITVSGFLTYFAWNNARLADAANKALAKAEYEAYVGAMGSMAELWEDGNSARIESILDATAASKYRGWEWGYWRRLVDPGQARTDAFVHGSSPKLSSDGHYLASYSHNAVVIANAHNFRILRKLPHKADNVYPIWVSNDRLIMASSTLTAPPELISARDGKVLARLGKIYFGQSIHCVSPDGKFALGFRMAADALEPVRVDLVSGTAARLGTEACNQAASDDRAFSRDGKLAAFAFNKTFEGHKLAVKIFDPHTWKPLQELPMPEIVQGLALSPDGNLLATTDLGGKVDLWDRRRGVKLCEVPAQKSQGASVQFSDDGRLLAANGNDHRLVIYRVGNAQLKEVGEYRGVEDFDFLPGSHSIMTTYHTTRIFNADHLASEQTKQFEIGEIASFEAWRGDTLRLEVGSQVEDVSLASEPAVRILAKNVPWRQMGGGDGLETGYDSQGAYVFDRAVNKTVLRLPSIYGKFPTAARGPGDSAVFVSPFGADFIELWDSSTHTARIRLDAPSGVSHWSLSEDRTRLAISQNDGGVRLFDAKTGRLLWTSQVNDGPTSSINFSFDGRLLLTAGSADETACVVDASTGAVLQRLEGHTGQVNSAVCSPDDKRVATCGYDKHVRIWDVATGRELLNLGPFDAMFREVRFSQDGLRLFGVHDSSVTIWSASPS